MTVICTSDAGFIALKAPENVWRPGSARTRWGSLSAPPDPLAAKWGRGVKGGEGKGKAGEGKGKGGERGGEGKGGGRGRGREGPHIFCCNSTTCIGTCVNNLPGVTFSSMVTRIRTHDLLIGSGAAQTFNHRSTMVLTSAFWSAVLF